MILSCRRRLGAFVALWMIGGPLTAQDTTVHDRYAHGNGNANADAKTMNDAVFGRLVTIDLDRVSIEKAINALATDAGIRVIYRARYLDAEKGNVTLHARKMKLGDALGSILRGTSLRAEAVTEAAIAIVPLARATPIATNAATGVVIGKVIDKATTKPIVAATVSVAGTGLSVMTGKDGRFRIPGVPAGARKLVARQLGYQPENREVNVAGGETATTEFALVPVATQLDQVVTTVTGQQRRLEVGNDISVINADSLVKAAPITTLSELLQSRVPGLSVRHGQGTVGGDVKLQIRGPSSILLSDEPIVVVNGIRYNSRPLGRVVTPTMAIATGGGTNGTGSLSEPVSPLNDLNPNDIETVEVVKGPSAATLYGADAANGVIVITTKRGRAGPARWNLYASRDYSRVPDEELQTDAQYYGWGTTFFGQTSSCTISSRLEPNMFVRCQLDSVAVTRSINTDKALSFYKPVYPWTAGANVSGGPQTLRYFAGGSYVNAQGGISVPDTIHALLRAAGAVLPKDFLRPNGQTMLNLSSNLAASAGANIDLTVAGNYTRANTRSIDMRNVLTDLRSGDIEPATGVDRLTGSVAAILSGASAEVNDRFFTNSTGRVRLTPWFTVNGVVGLDHATRNFSEFRERDSTSYITANGRVLEREGTSSVLTANGGASASARRGRFSAQTTVGTQYVRSTDTYLEALGEDLVPGTRSIAFAAFQSVSPMYAQTISLGSFVEQRFGWNDRLFATAAVRADGSSAFGEGYHAKGYPKFSFSWLASQEPFFPKIFGLSELRLRSAYGVAGRQPSATDQLPQLTTQDQCYVDAQCLRQTIGNSDLRPERSTEWEGGLDAGLLGQRMQLGLSWYHRRTRDQLLSEVLPLGMGRRLTNLGLTTQGGFEAQMTATVIETGPVALSVTMNHSSYHTKVIDLGAAQPKKDKDGGYVEGYPIGARFIVPFFGYEDKNGDGMLYEGPSSEPSDEFFYGSNLPDSLVYAGTADAPRRQNVTLMLGLWSNRLRLSANVAREAGSTVLLAGCARCRGVFDSTATLAEQASALRMRSVSGLPVSATFTRLREVSAAVTLPARLVRQLRASSGSVAISGRDLGLWTSTKMSDPESAAIGLGKPNSLGFGVPRPQQWALRVDLGL